MHVHALRRWLHGGVPAALAAALLFGAGTPLAKWLLGSVGPWLLAGLFYIGSGLGLTFYRWVVKAPRVRLASGEWGWLLGAIASGGVIGPVLLMVGLSGMPASGASLLLNAEGVLTALLAWFAFRENFDRRIALGMVSIAAGTIVLSWPEDTHFSEMWPALSVVGACFAWGVDNNLTRKVALNDATWIAAVKGLVAGCVNLTLASLVGDKLPGPVTVAAAMGLGFLAYGVSLACFVVALRNLGTSRTGAYFSVAPFFGALLALLSGEPVSAKLCAAGGLMAFGVWLHLTENHAHAHDHEALEHDHAHVHDAHHQHSHVDGQNFNGRHAHPHHHAPMRHSHAHYPDAHHRHSH